MQASLLGRLDALPIAPFVGLYGILGRRYSKNDPDRLIGSDPSNNSAYAIPFRCDWFRRDVIDPTAVWGQNSQAFSKPQFAIGTSIQDSIVALARRQLGQPYVLGGASPETGFDCSGLIQYLLRSFQIDTPHNFAGQAVAGVAVPRDVSRLGVGDLLTFGYRHESLTSGSMLAAGDSFMPRLGHERS